MRNHVPGRRRPWRALLSALSDLAGGKAEVLLHQDRPWASVTFAGTHHTLSLAFTGPEATAAGESFIAALPEHEFALSRQIVADAAVTAVRHDMLDGPKLTVEIELLLLEDA